MKSAGEQFHSAKMIEDELISVGHGRIGRLRGHLLLGRAIQAVDALDPDLGDGVRGAVLGGVVAGVEFAGDLEMGSLGESGGIFSQAADTRRRQAVCDWCSPDSRSFQMRGVASERVVRVESFRGLRVSVSLPR